MNVLVTFLLLTNILGALGEITVYCDEFITGNFTSYFFSTRYLIANGNDCVVKDYKFLSDQDYRLNQGDLITKLTIRDSSMEKIFLIDKGMTYLKTLIVTNTTLKHVDKFKHCEFSILDLSSNQIVSLHKKPFIDCYKLKKINLSYNKLVFLSGELQISDIRTTILEINLSHNYIESIAANSFFFINFENLDLSYNSLEEIDFSFFTRTETTTRIINLSNNNLTNIHSISYNLLRNTSLIINHNALTFLDLSNLKDGFSKINFAEYNKISNLYLGPSTSKYESLRFSYNNFGNNIQEICKCENLKEIALSKNSIDNIGLCFSKMRYLEYVSLGSNNIRSVSRESFHPLNAIRYLHLDNNRLKTFDEYTMSIYTKLKELYLEGNEIFEFYENPKYLMPNIIKLHLSRNKLKCSKLYLITKKCEETGVELSFDKVISVNDTNIKGISCQEVNYSETDLFSDDQNKTIQEWAYKKISEVLDNNIVYLINHNKLLMNKMLIHDREVKTLKDSLRTLSEAQRKRYKKHV